MLNFPCTGYPQMYLALIYKLEMWVNDEIHFMQKKFIYKIRPNSDKTHHNPICCDDGCSKRTCLAKSLYDLRLLLDYSIWLRCIEAITLITSHWGRASVSSKSMHWWRCQTSNWKRGQIHIKCQTYWLISRMLLQCNWSTNTAELFHKLIDIFLICIIGGFLCDNNISNCDINLQI